jgi:hypothetical protein
MMPSSPPRWGAIPDLDKTFLQLKSKRIDALAIAADTFFSSQSRYLAALAMRYVVPTVVQRAHSENEVNASFNTFVQSEMVSMG